MTEIRKADRAARRHAALLIAVAAVVGVLAITALERYRIPLQDWILADPEAATQRFGWLLYLAAALLAAPLLGLAAYLWWIGERIVRAKEFPPPGARVLRDTRVVTGVLAISRGRRFKLAALVCALAAIAVGLALSRLAWSLGGP